MPDDTKTNENKKDDDWSVDKLGYPWGKNIITEEKRKRFLEKMKKADEEIETSLNIRGFIAEPLRKLGETLSSIPPPPPPLEIPINAIVLPEREEFMAFYGYYKTGLEMVNLPDSKLDKYILSVSLFGAGFNISVPAIVELLYDKYNTPRTARAVAEQGVSRETAETHGFPLTMVQIAEIRAQGKVPDISDPHFDIGRVLAPPKKRPPPTENEATKLLLDIQNIDSLLGEKMMWLKAEFNRIVVLNDPETRRLCQEYHDAHSLPLQLRLKYYEWEAKQMNIKIDARIAEYCRQKDDELRGIRRDIEQQAEDKMTKLEQKNRALQIKYEELYQKGKQASELHQDALEKLREEKEFATRKEEELKRIRAERLTLDQKNIELENQIAALNKQVSLLAKRNEDLSKRMSGETPWRLAPNTTLETLTYINQETGEKVRFLNGYEGFKKMEFIEKGEGDTFIFRSQDGSHELKMPASLFHVFEKLLAPLTGVTETKSPGIPQPVSPPQPQTKTGDIIPDVPRPLEETVLNALASGPQLGQQLAILLKKPLMELVPHLRGMVKDGSVLVESTPEGARYSLPSRPPSSK